MFLCIGFHGGDMDQFIRTGLIFLVLGVANLALLAYYVLISPSGGSTIELVLHAVLGVLLTAGGLFFIRASPVKKETQG